MIVTVLLVAALILCAIAEIMARGRDLTAWGGIVGFAALVYAQLA